MARSFDGSADYIHFSGAGIDETAAMAACCWFYRDSDAGWDRILSLNNGNRGFQFVQHHAQQDVGVVSGTTASWSGLEGGASTVGAWHHLGGNVNSSGSVIAAYLDGSSISTATSGYGVGSDLDQVTIGARSGGSSYFGGDIAHVAVWNGAALTADEFAALAKGFSPLLIRPSALVFYTPLDGRTAEIDWIGGHVGTHVSSPPKVAGPGIVMPSQYRFGLSTGGGAPAGNAMPMAILQMS